MQIDDGVRLESCFGLVKFNLIKQLQSQVDGVKANSIRRLLKKQSKEVKFKRSGGDLFQKFGLRFEQLGCVLCWYQPR